MNYVLNISLTIAFISKIFLASLSVAAANRPLKLAETISELYDNEWTNAIEKLVEMGVPEEKGIRILLKIIQVSLT